MFSDNFEHLLTAPIGRNPPQKDDSHSNQKAPEDTRNKPMFFEDYFLETPPLKKSPTKSTNFGGHGDVPSRHKPPKRLDFGGLITPSRHKPPTNTKDFDMDVPLKSKPPKLDDASLILGLPFGKFIKKTRTLVYTGFAALTSYHHFKKLHLINLPLKLFM